MIPVMLLILTAVIRHKTSEPSTSPAKRDHPSTHSRLLVRVDTWINRVENFMYGASATKADDNYQVNQAKIAVANGGWIGLGPGNSRQRNFLPHPYSDFI